MLPQARCECGKAAADSEDLIQQAIGAGACEALENPLDRDWVGACVIEGGVVIETTRPRQDSSQFRLMLTVQAPLRIMDQ